LNLSLQDWEYLTRSIRHSRFGEGFWKT